MKGKRRVLVMGATGMLGHKVCQVLRPTFDVWGTVRTAGHIPVETLEPSRILSGIDAADLGAVARAIWISRPDTIVNCVGIIKQLPSAKDPIASITLNSLFPHRLHILARLAGARLVQLSTDCVFSGRKGGYTEADAPDPVDLYGHSKLLGEVAAPGALTLRTSMVGRELTSRNGLVEWFLSNEGASVKGFRHAVFSGLTTLGLSRVVKDVIEHHPDLEGVYHVSSAPIDKLELLRIVREAYHAKIEIASDESVRIDRSLDSSKFRKVTGFRPDPWPDAIREMAADPYPYPQRRSP